MGTDYGRRRGDAGHLAAPQPAQVGMETTSGTVTGAGVAGSSSPGGSAPCRHAVKRLKLSRPAIADFGRGLE